MVIALNYLHREYIYTTHIFTAHYLFGVIMITVSKAAAEQILDSTKQGESAGMKLRLAANKKEDGSIEYAMGFEERDLDDDIFFDSEGVKIVVSAGCFELLKGTELDYVKLDDNEEMQFIFKNPNDPNYKAENSGTEHHY